MKPKCLHRFTLSGSVTTDSKRIFTLTCSLCGKEKTNKRKLPTTKESCSSRNLKHQSPTKPKKSMLFNSGTSGGTPDMEGGILTPNPKWKHSLPRKRLINLHKPSKMPLPSLNTQKMGLKSPSQGSDPSRKALGRVGKAHSAPHPQKLTGSFKTHRNPIRKVSEKRKELNKQYGKVRDAFMEEHPACQFPGCKDASVDLHHKRGRLGKLLIDPDHMMALCRHHHDWAHLNVAESRKMGIIQYSFRS
jgi:hypothetical protein